LCPLFLYHFTDIWPGISLHYDHVTGGIVESTYRIEPGANIGMIRLRYNAPVEIGPVGSLLINYSTGKIATKFIPSH
jgi:hypothetical protein